MSKKSIFGARKLMVLLLSILLIALVVLAGCSNEQNNNEQNQDVNQSENNNTSNESENTPGTWVSDEQVEFSFMFNDKPNEPYNKDWPIWNEITDKTNVKLDPMVVLNSDYDKKRKLLLNTGEAPDFIPMTSPGQETEFVPSGVLLPVSDYMDQLPHFQEKLEKWDLEEELNTIKQMDGKLYVLPGLVESPQIDFSFVVRKDIREKHGIEIPNNYVEFYEMLKTLKEEYPESLPMSDFWKKMFGVIAPAFGTVGGWDVGNGMLFNEEKDEWVFAPTTEGHKQFVTYFHKLIDEGLLDPESFTQKNWKKRIVNGSSFVVIGKDKHVAEFGANGQTSVGPEFELELIPPMAGPAGPIVRERSHFSRGVIIPSSVKDKPYFNELLAFLDWLYYSDEGIELMSWGVEGVTYETVDGKNKLMNDIDINGLYPDANKNLTKDFGVQLNTFLMAISEEGSQNFMTEDSVKFSKKINETRTMRATQPIAHLTDAEREEANLLGTTLGDYTHQMMLKFMLGSVSIEEEWDNYVEQSKVKGSEKLTELMNKGHERYKEVTSDQ